MSLRLFLLRHGETDWNRERRHQGRTDTPLSEIGHGLKVVPSSARITLAPFVPQETPFGFRSVVKTEVEAQPAADNDPDLPKVGDSVLNFRLRALNPDMAGQFVGIDSVTGYDHFLR